MSTNKPEEYIYQPPSTDYRIPLYRTNDIKKHLKDYGWVVLSEVASLTESANIVDKQWDYLETLGTGIRHKDPQTWYESGRWPSSISTGQILVPWVGHNPAMWYARLLPSVKKVFEIIYDTKDLLVSYDTMNIVRPYTLATNRTKPLPPHIDQNPLFEPEFMCYQGLLNLIDSEMKDGGTMILSGSHKHFGNYTKYSKNKLDINTGGHYRFIGEHEKNMISDMVCPTLKVGDFLIWDGRLVHGVAPPKKNKKDKKGTAYLRRSVVYISMIPRTKLSEENIKIRYSWFQKGITSGHSLTMPMAKKITPYYPRKIPYIKTDYKVPYFKEPSDYSLVGRKSEF